MLSITVETFKLYTFRYTEINLKQKPRVSERRSNTALEESNDKFQSTILLRAVTVNKLCKVYWETIVLFKQFCGDV